MSKSSIVKQVDDGKKLTLFVDIDPIQFLKREDLQATLNLLGNEVLTEVFDINTPKGRKDNKALGTKIRKSKKFVADAALAHARALKSESNAFDSQRKVLNDFMDDLYEKATKPLTDWEAKEKARADAIFSRINAMMATTCGMISERLSSLDSAKEFFDEVSTTVIDDSFGDQEDRANQVKTESLLMIGGVVAKFEQDAIKEQEAEKSRLKAEAEAKVIYEQKIAKEAKKKAEREAAEKAAKLKAKVEQEKIAAENKAKAERAKMEADKQQAIEAEKAAIEAQKQAEANAKQAIQDEKDRTEKIKKDAELKAKQQAAQAVLDKENAIKAEQARVAKIEAKKDAVKRQEQVAAEKKAANKKHRARINNEILVALSKYGINEESGRNLIIGICKNEVKHLFIQY